MKIAFHAAAALFLAATTSAGAADLPEPPAVPSIPPVIEEPPWPDWSGPYAGLHGGGAWMDAILDDCRCVNLNGRRVGGFAGYNWVVSSGYVVGIEGDVTYDWNEQVVGATRLGTDLSGSVRLRVGEEMGNFLPYVAAGWTVTNPYIENPNDNDVVNGWTVGAGIDWAATETTFLRLEYRYNDYSTATLEGVDTKIDQDIISIGIGRKF
ncbi:porin family protein [Ensifer sp. NM-2]|uniref:outer membrane protein n=1 Tax=Ensifer sp. NM-2 TaxID=2109730 RepID=UPI000D129A9F|nr:outer membrane beta-barrel protein [Ensifer sp. NM-2]PSS59531.1 porin family protein [Ensifer sp. NM-2]